MAPIAVENNGFADGRVGGRIENYTKFWQKDISKEANVDTDNRLDSYTDVINGSSPSQILTGFTNRHGTLRLLRWRDRALRIWLGQILPLLALLQRRSIRRIPCPS